MKRVRSLDGLMAAALDRRAVICPKSPAYRGPRPAAWVIHLPGAILHRMLKTGLYIYESQK